METQKDADIKKIVFVGDVRIGESLVRNIQKAGFDVANDVGDADAILIYTCSQSDLEDVFFDTNGVIQAAQKGAYLINLSATTPNFARELNAVALVSDLHPVEAPLFAINPIKERAFSDTANLACFLGGDQSDKTAVYDLMNAFVGSVHMVEDASSAQLARAAMTLIHSSQMLACIEAEALCHAYTSTSNDVTALAIEKGIVADTNMSLVKAIQKEELMGEYSIEVWRAELTAALMAADDVELILPATEAGAHLLELLVIIGGSEKNAAALSLIYGEESLCAKHGLDWTRLEEAYPDDHEYDHDHDHAYDDDDFLGGFGTYSSN